MSRRSNGDLIQLGRHRLKDRHLPRLAHSVRSENRSRLIMRVGFFSIFLTDPVKSGSPGVEFFLNEGNYWPVAGCERDKACYAWKIQAKPGWENSNAKNLRYLLKLLCHATSLSKHNTFGSQISNLYFNELFSA